MADFGDDELFLEFEKDRQTQETFLHVNSHESDDRIKSHFVFKFTGEDSDDDSSSDEDSGKNESSQISAAADSNGLDSQGNGDSGNYETSEYIPPERTSYQDSFQLKTLKKFANVIDSTKHVQLEESPAVQIIFQNNAFARKYRPYLEGMIAELLAKERQSQERLPKLNLRTTSLTCVDLNDELPTEMRNNAMWEAHAIIGAAQYFPNFIVDTLGWPLVDSNPALTPGYPEIIYEQIFADVLGVVEDDSAGPSKPDKPKQSCFNCQGDHNLSECKLPKDFSRISKNRQAFQKNKKEVSNVRYHESPELNSKYAHMRPGHLSEELREALGLEPHQLPTYIYRMRALGYPPGWLAEATNNSSGLVMFDKDGNEVNLQGESMEDGEVGENQPSQGPDLDVRRIIEYPGFTVPLPEDIQDEHERYNMPPLQLHQLKATLQKNVEEKEKSLKRKQKREEERKVKKAKLERTGDEMDLCEEDDNSQTNDSLPSLGHNPSGSNSPIHSTPMTHVQRSGSHDSQSPTLEMLQEQYKQLQDQISDIDQSSEAPASLETSESIGTQPLFSDSQGAELSQDSQNSSVRSTPRSSGKTSLSSVFTTPVREASMKASLPDREKFAVGAEDHLLFENLPDSTGTFEKMRGLVKKIRETKVQVKKKDSE